MVVILPPPPCINNARSEYLVDTESNTIIYPKTRLEDIIGLENLPSKPGSILGGIDPNSYIHKLVNLQGVVFAGGQYTTLGRIELANPGIYFINLNIQIVVLPAYSGYNESSLQISTPSQSHKSDFLINNSTYGRRTMSIIEKVEEPINVQFGVYIITPTFTCNNKSFYQYTILKLCDIP